LADLAATGFAGYAVGVSRRSTSGRLEDHAFNLMLVQDGSGGSQGRDNQALKGARILGLLNLLDLSIKAFHVNSAAPHKGHSCAVNVAVEPDESHTLVL
jgi:hypothetical protein